MNQAEMLKIVEQYSRNAVFIEGQTKVTRVQDSKTMVIETIGEVGRSVYMTEFKVDGKTYWAGHSSRSNTVFVSQAV